MHGKALLSYGSPLSIKSQPVDGEGELPYPIRPPRRGLLCLTIRVVLSVLLMKHLLFVLFLLAVVGFTRGTERPNIVVILCDDLGWGDLENCGHPHIKTPRLMELAAGGIQFSSFYSAAPVCSPARVGLLTGRNPNRAGVYNWIPGVDPGEPVKDSRALVEMRREEFTIPRMLKKAGYATCMVGKWHCNAMFNSPKQAQPGDHGFDHWFATQNNADPSHENPKNFVRNGKEVGPIEGYSCQIVADEAVAWLEEHGESDPDQPFFIYMAFHEPHEPVASPPDLVAKYEAGAARNHDEAQYFANVENLDAATGTLIDAIERLGHREDTLILFTSDNGPETLKRYRGADRSYGTPGPWRGMKLHTHEAGFRVAGIASWPGEIAPGSQSDVPVSSLDFLPTFARLAGVTLPPDLVLDGTDCLPALRGEPMKREKPLLWAYYSSYDGEKYLPTVAMRDGDWKIRATLAGLPRTNQVDEGNIEAVKAAVLRDFEIYDLSSDPGEKRPLEVEGSSLPEKLSRLYGELLGGSHVWPEMPR